MIDFLKIKYVKWILFIQNLILRLIKLTLYTECIKYDKIIIFRTGSIGDTICAFPAIVAIRKHFNHSQIHILTNAGNLHTNLVSMERILDSAFYDRLIDYNGYTSRQLFNYLRKEQYDLIIELPQNEASLFVELRNMIFFRFARIRSGFGWQVHTSFVFRQTQERHLKFESETQTLLSILKRNKIVIQSPNLYPLNLTDEDRSTVETILRLNFSEVEDHNRLIALVPGAKRLQNRYPLIRFVELAKWLSDKKYKIIVIGGSEDVKFGDAIAINSGIISFCGKLTPMQSAILMSKCFLTISNDTGPMHLSYAIGTPVIGLFSSRDFPAKWFPPVGNIVLRNDHVHCSVCLSENCKNNICMQGISLESIKEAFSEMERRFIKR